MCESSARQKLVGCPADIEQRLADGLKRTISVLDAACTPPVFDFIELMQNPVAHLPVVYSSSSYRSPVVVPTEYPQVASPVTEYWFGS
jgi:hypothetical protein